MESTTPITSQQEDELSLKDLILKTQEWIKYLWKKWLIISAFGLLGAGIGLTYALFKEPMYLAELTFVLEDSKSASLGTYAGLASQFGIDLGGAGAGSGVFSGDNILEFLKSRLMVEKALLSPVTINGKTQSLADLYIDINELRESWKGKPSLKTLHFPVNLSRKEFSLQQDSVLFRIYDAIIKKNLSVTKPDKKLNFISVKFTTKDEVFSKAFTERLVKEATVFYVQTKTQRSKVTVDRLQEKSDSIELLLNRKTYTVAASQDMNLNPARNIAGVSTELATRDKIVLQTMYGEIVKNLELSRMAMAQEMPIIQIIDTPILPLKRKELGNLKGMVLGGFLGGFLTISLLILRKLYKGIMI